MASAVLHLVVLGALALSIGPFPPLPVSHAIEVSLWSPPAPPRAAKPGPREPRAAIREARAAPPPEAWAPPPIALPGSDSVHATDDLRDLLRASIGCEHAAAFNLTPEELDRCRRRARRLGDGDQIYAVRPADPRKLADFEAAARRNEAERRAREGPMGTAFVNCSGPGSNFGVGCLVDHPPASMKDTQAQSQRGPWR